MRAPPDWFDRTFSVPYPVELLPLLYARLRGSPARLEEIMRRGPQERLTTRVEDKWSAQENAGHLLDLEPLWLARVGDFEAGADAMTPADLGNSTTRDADYNRASLERILADYRAARERLLRRVEALGEHLFARVIPHPRLMTPMRLADHLYFVAEHDDHHLARIWTLLNSHRQ